MIIMKLTKLQKNKLASLICRLKTQEERDYCKLYIEAKLAGKIAIWDKLVLDHVTTRPISQRINDILN